jgi:hypothetical protein
MIVDPSAQLAARRQDLLHEADLERLAAQLPHRPSAMRHELALACIRLADWLAESPEPQMGTLRPANRDLRTG